MTTICVECKFHYLPSLSHCDGCAAPEFTKDKGQKRDFVTGEWWYPNGLPSCEDINTGGNCPHYKPKKLCYLPLSADIYDDIEEKRP